MRVAVHDVTGDNAVLRAKGQELYDQIYPALLAGSEVNVDFAGVKVFSSPFLNVAVGQLLRDIAPETLNRLLHFENITPAGVNALRVVISSAKEYYSDEQTALAIDEAVSDEVRTA